MINIFNFLFLIPDVTKTKNFYNEKNMCNKEVENTESFLILKVWKRKEPRSFNL